jgi:hypothetical protein
MREEEIENEIRMQQAENGQKIKRAGEGEEEGERRRRGLDDESSDDEEDAEMREEVESGVTLDPEFQRFLNGFPYSARR